MHAIRSLARIRTRSLALLALTGLGACASQERAIEKMPFHVAIAPASVDRDATSRPADGNPTELALAFDETKLMDEIAANAGATFVRVTRLSPSEPGATTAVRHKAWVAEAQQKGADLLLVPRLRYDSRVHTELNDRFWLNLPLFALGGPFCWFVADRSYLCHARLDGEVFDVTAAAASKRPTLDRTSRVHEFKRESTEASLNFLDRASGAGPYLLSMICPAGLLATESAGIPPELDAAVTQQLCQEMTRSLRDGTTEIAESDLVDFFPRDVRVGGEGSGRSLVGEFVLRIGTATELGKLRYRAGAEGEWRDATWSPMLPEATADRKVYPFLIRLDGVTTDTLQVQVEQLDQDLTRRTFTFPLGTSRSR
jgi:hypothetical protein